MLKDVKADRKCLAGLKVRYPILLFMAGGKKGKCPDPLL